MCMQTTEETPQPTSTLFGLLTREELAAQLKVTVRTIQRWETLRCGPPRVVIFRQTFYRITSVDAWLESRETRRSR